MTRSTVRYAAAALMLLAASPFLSATPSRAAPPDAFVSELKIGVLAHDVPDLWSGFRDESNSVDINVEALLAPHFLLFGGELRPAIGASINTAGDTSHAYIDARWQYAFDCGLFLGLGLGAAIHNGELEPVRDDAKALGSRVLFHIPLELGIRLDAHNSLSAYFEHTSNANTADYNEGLDRLGIRYGYRF